MIHKLLLILFAIVMAAYIIWPLDIIPDFIPVIGWIDDLFAGIVGFIAVIMAIRT